MRILRCLAFVSVFSALTLRLAMAQGSAEHPVPPIPARKQLVLASGRVVPVYRVKYWTFRKGDPPALQLQYQTAVPLSDTAALRREAIELWPPFARYVEGMKLRGAILTATEPARVDSLGTFWKSRERYFGFVVVRDSAGVWRLRGHPAPLPPAERDGPLHLIDVDGRPMPIPAAPQN